MKKILASITVLFLWLALSFNATYAEEIIDLDSLLNNAETVDIQLVWSDSSNNTTFVNKNLQKIDVIDKRVSQIWGEWFIIIAKSNKKVNVDGIVDKFLLNTTKQEDLLEFFDISYIDSNGLDNKVLSNTDIIPSQSEIYMRLKSDNPAVWDFPVMDFDLNENVKFIKFWKIKIDWINEIEIKWEYVYPVAENFIQPTLESELDNVVDTTILKEKETGLTENIAILIILLTIMGVYIAKNKKEIIV